MRIDPFVVALICFDLAKGTTVTTDVPENVTAAHVQTVRDLTTSGAAVEAGEETRGRFTELLGYTTGMADPLKRITGGERPFNTVAGVARFVWLVSGSDRLEDIAYYEDKVRHFTDDHISVPGSSYGRRIFNSAPGVNQLKGVVDELRHDPESRRAAAVVWLPDDAIRKSKDIPCTFGIFFHVRDGGLIMTTVMRSNNAVTLLPYNFFEFSMIGEMVAAEIGVPFHRYVHWAASMHFFDFSASEITKILAVTTPTAIRMPEMPHGDALAKAALLARFEAKLRHCGTLEELQMLAADAHAELGEYWSAFFDVLYAYGLAKREHRAEAREVFDALPDYFRGGAAKVMNPLLDTVLEHGDDVAGTLFDLIDIEQHNQGSVAARVAAGANRADDLAWLLSVLKDSGMASRDISLEDVLAVHERLAQNDVALAARGEGQATELTAADVIQALEDVQRERGA